MYLSMTNFVPRRVSHSAASRQRVHTEFVFQLGDTYNSIKRPLFVLLNDLDEIKEQFALVIVLVRARRACREWYSR